MNPSDWVADCMVPDAWLHEPFAIDGMAVACDGSALVAFPGQGKQYKPARFDGESDPTNQIRAALSQAKIAVTAPAGELKSLPISAEHLARLASQTGLQVEIHPNRVIFKCINTDTGELSAFGVIYIGGKAQ